MSNLDIVDIRDDIREDRGGVDQFNTDNMAGGQLTVLRETTARLRTCFPIFLGRFLSVALHR